jgi:hypothetical protein
MVSFTPWPLYPGERGPGGHWMGGSMGPRTGLNEKYKKKFLPLPGFQSQPFRRPVRRLNEYEGVKIKRIQVPHVTAYVI